MRKPPPTTAQARARAREARDVRIDAIVDLMLAGRWESGRSHRRLAEQYGCSSSTIAEDARAASAAVRRLVPLDPSEREDWKARHLADLERHRRLALKHARTDPRALTGANQVLDQRAKVLGLYEAQKIDVTTREAPRTKDEEMAQIDELVAELLARKAELQDEGKGTIQ